MSLRNARSKEACFQGENRKPGITGTVARKESRLPERNASMRLLREVLPGENRTSWPTDFLLFAQAQFVNSPGCPSWTSPVPKSTIIPWGVVLDENSTLERLKSFPVVLLPNNEPLGIAVPRKRYRIGTLAAIRSILPVCANRRFSEDFENPGSHRYEDKSVRGAVSRAA